MSVLARLRLGKLSTATSNHIDEKPVPWVHSTDPNNHLTVETVQMQDMILNGRSDVFHSKVIKIKCNDDYLVRCLPSRCRSINSMSADAIATVCSLRC